MEQITVVKVGGKILEDEATLQALLRDFAAIEGKKVLVHGGGRSATKMAARLGVETTMIEGRRVTDDAMLDIVTMVYGGLVNKQVVARLQACGINALGVTGADLNLIHSHKRPVGAVDYGWVGDVDAADSDMLGNLIAMGAVPVVAPLTHDGMGHLLNTNADSMAGAVATALARLFDVRLVFCFEKEGVLEREDDDNSVIPVINLEKYARLKADGVVKDGMIPKLDNSFGTLHRGVKEVIITKAANLTDLAKGTHIVL